MKVCGKMKKVGIKVIVLLSLWFIAACIYGLITTKMRSGQNTPHYPCDKLKPTIAFIG